MFARRCRCLARPGLIGFAALLTIGATQIRALDYAFWIEAQRMDSESANKFTTRYQDNLYVRQLIPIEVRLVFMNRDGHAYSYRITCETSDTVPLFGKAWEDKTGQSTRAGDRDTLTYPLMIWSNAPGEHVFQVKAILNHPWGKVSDQIDFKIQIQEGDASLVPRLAKTSSRLAPEYNPGAALAVDWFPAGGQAMPAVQDVYAYDLARPSDLIRSAQRLYKAGSGETRSEIFEGLRDAHTYGVYAKADYLTDDGLAVYYSDPYFTLQDQTPPETVPEPVIQTLPECVRVSWDAVADGGSGVASYQIFRSEDTGYETLVHTAPEDGSAFYVWEDGTVDMFGGYTYRVRAVDFTGNVGDGMRSPYTGSEIVLGETPDLDFSEGTIPSLSGDRLLISGTVDSLLPIVDAPHLDSVLVQVARDDTLFWTSPPDLPLRLFSQTVKPPFVRHWRFDYAFSGETEVNAAGDLVYHRGEYVDPNLVNGHLYYPKLTYYFRHGLVREVRLPPRLIDCFAPQEARNVQAQTWIIDPENGAFTRWAATVRWQPPPADNGSGLKQFHVYRQAPEESAFQNIITVGADVDFYIDTLVNQLPGLQNGLIRYRIVPEDLAGNRLAAEAVTWEASDRALYPPQIAFRIRDNESLYNDTLYTHADTVLFRFYQFRMDAVDYFITRVNNEVKRCDLDGFQQLRVAIDRKKMHSDIQVRAVYHGGRSSVWSHNQVAIRDSVPPSVLHVTNHPDSSSGALYLTWDRSSLAVSRYHIYRSEDRAVWTPVDSVWANRDTLTWVDRTEKITYQPYFYKVRPYTKTRRFETESNVDSDYCNNPPTLFYHAIIPRDSGRFDIDICWRRARPVAADNRFITHVSVYIDSLYGQPAFDVVANDLNDTCYTLYGAGLEHNYLFRVREELDEDPLRRISGLSQPYTVSLKTLGIRALSQPFRKIFLSWDRTIRDTPAIHAFQLRRTGKNGMLDTLLAPHIGTYMDVDSSLIAGENYRYQILALDSRHHILAANDTVVYCDGGKAYVPALAPLPAYINQKKLPVSWAWEREGKRSQTTLGADSLFLEISIKGNFPRIPVDQTVIYDFKADPGVLAGVFDLPVRASNVNHQIFVRMFAKDPWGNPVPLVESNRVSTIYDVILPERPDTLFIAQRIAYDIATDSVKVRLSWVDSSLEDVHPLVANISHYDIYRRWNGREFLVGTVNRPAGGPRFSFEDTLANQNASWRIASVDSAGNQILTDWLASPRFAETPGMAEFSPLSLRTCHVRPTQKAITQYKVEVAMFAEHFRLAYRLNDNSLDRLLCRSPWIAVANDTFQCRSGWGSHFQMDSTWFRIKTQLQPGWESGWSDSRLYVKDGFAAPKTAHVDAETIPESFGVTANHPNPFNAGTCFQYALPEPAEITVRIYNMIGKCVRRLHHGTPQQAGVHTIRWQGDDDAGNMAATGIYFYEVIARSESGVNRQQHKMMMIK